MNSNFSLVIERQPKDYYPISVFSSLDELDNFTKQYSRDELSSVLVNNNYIDKSEYDCDYEIIYNNNGIRKLNDGVMYRDDAPVDIYEFVINYMLRNKEEYNIINNMYQYVISKKGISEDTYMLLDNINKDKKDTNKYINDVLELKSINYFDIRLLYFYIIKVLLVLDKSKNLKRTIEK